MKNEITTTRPAGSLSLTGKRSYDAAIRVFNQWLEGRPVSPETVREYLAFCEKEYAPRTFNHKRHALKKSIQDTALKAGADSARFLFEVGLLFNEVKSVKVDNTPDEGDYLTRDELAALADDTRTGLIIQALYQTAYRIAELLKARVTDCAISPSVVKVSVIGKGRKENVSYMKRELFDKLRKAYPNGVYLLNTASGKPLHPANVHKMVVNHAKKCGIKKHVHCHSLRHTWGTLNVETIGIEKVSKYLNHSSLATTQIYIHNKVTESDFMKTL